MEYKIIITHKGEQLTGATLQGVFAAEVQEVALAVDIKALAKLKGRTVKQSTVPMVQAARLVVVLADGLKHHYPVGTLLVPFDADVYEALRQDLARFKVVDGVLAPNGAWTEPKVKVSDLDEAE